MQIDMGRVLTVAGTAVQGRRGNSQYLKTYTVATSLDGTNFQSVGGVYNGGAGLAKNLFESGGKRKARYVRIYVRTWHGHASARADVLVTESFITSGTPAVAGTPLNYSGADEHARSYSSVYNNDAIGTNHARSTINSPQAWSAKNNKTGEWMQIDMGRVLTVAGTAVQGRRGNSQYLKTYTVATSLDGTNFQSVGGVYNGGAGLAKNLFESGGKRKARYVRIYVRTWHGHASARADVLITDAGPSAGIAHGAKAAIPGTGGKLAGINHGAKAAVPGFGGKPAGISIPGRAASVVVDEDVNRAGVPEHARTYSSIYNNDKPGVGYGRSKLDSPQAWSAAFNRMGEWMQIDLGQEMQVAGIAIQPRNGGSQYVKTYTVATSRDGTTFTNLPGVYNGHATKTLDNKFIEGRRPRARYVRIYPQSWYGHMSMRANVLISKGEGPPAAGAGAGAGYGLGKRLVIENKNAPGEYLSVNHIGPHDTGASLILWNNASDAVTQWYLVDIGNGQYNIMNVHSIQCVNVSRHRQDNGANVIQWNNPKSPETRFNIKTVGGGAMALGEVVTIESCYTGGRYLNACFGKRGNGTKILLLDNPDKWATQWIIREAGESSTCARL